MKKLCLALVVSVISPLWSYAVQPSKNYVKNQNGYITKTEEIEDVQGRIDKIDNDVNYLTWSLLPAMNDGLTIDRHPDIADKVNEILKELRDERKILEDLKNQ